jgi:hypothetical protein
MVVLRDATSRLRAKTTHHGQMMSLTIFTVNCFDMAMMRGLGERRRVCPCVESGRGGLENTIVFSRGRRR